MELFKNNDGTADLEKLVHEIQNTSMGGEDFSFFSKAVPGSMFYIGHRSSNDTAVAGHSPRFAIDEAVLYRGAAFYTTLALDFLSVARGVGFRMGKE